jgi:hypothetical protein
MLGLRDENVYVLRHDDVPEDVEFVFLSGGFEGELELSLGDGGGN